MSALVLLFMWLFSDVEGQFVLAKGPSCSDGSLVYSCTTSTSFIVTWKFQPSGARKDIGDGDSSPQVVVVGSSTVLLAILSSNISSISVTATMAYSDAVGLNGTSIQCDTEDILTINVPNVMTNLPASLRIQKIQNIIIIHPTPNIAGVFYNVTSHNNVIRSGVLNGNAIFIQESNNVSFFCIETSYSFNIGECIFLDYNENLTYTLFDENWTITCFNYSNEISDIMCMSDGNWSAPNLCQAAGSENEITENINNCPTTTETNFCSEKCGSCGNIMAYLVAPLVAIFFALIGNILVMALCFVKKRKKNLEVLSSTQLSKTSTGKGNTNTQERCAVTLVDNVAYDYITTK